MCWPCRHHASIVFKCSKLFFLKGILLSYPAHIYSVPSQGDPVRVIREFVIVGIVARFWKVYVTHKECHTLRPNLDDANINQISTLWMFIYETLGLANFSNTKHDWNPLKVLNNS